MDYRLITPPKSSGSAYSDDFKQPLVSVSTRFCPRDDDPADLMFITEDGVLFSVHRRVLEKSSNGFAGLLTNDPTCNSFVVPEASDVFNLMLHSLYDYDPAPYTPTLEQIGGTLDILSKYGIPKERVVYRGSYFATVLMGMALSLPFDTYALVCHHALEDMAVEVSQHLINIPLYNLTDAQCVTMGPTYLRRLIFLHLGRTERLRTLLHAAKVGHPPTPQCDVVDQKLGVQAAWHNALHEFCDDIGPGTSISVLKAHLSPVADKLKCAMCVASVRDAVRKLILDWATVKSTI